MYDELETVRNLFTKFVDQLYDINPIFGWNRGKMFYRIVQDKAYHQKIYDDGDRPVIESYIKLKKCRLLYEYNIQEIEWEWLKTVSMMSDCPVSKMDLINDYIASHQIELLKHRSKLVDKYMPAIVMGFKQDKMMQYILERPSMRMLQAGECALTHPFLRSCSED